MSEVKIHKKWLRTTETTPRVEKEQPVRHGIEPLLCDACKRGFIPANGAQVYCTAPNCVRDRATKRQQERRRLQQMLAEADQKRQEYDAIGKAQMAEAKRAFRETRGLS